MLILLVRDIHTVCILLQIIISCAVVQKMLVKFYKPTVPNEDEVRYSMTESGEEMNRGRKQEELVEHVRGWVHVEGG